MRTAISVGETLLAKVRTDVFRSILMRPIPFFDRHKSSTLTGLVVSEVDTIRMILMSNVARDRGLRALLEAAGSVLVLFVMSWRLGPILAGRLGGLGEEGGRRGQMGGRRWW